VKNSPAQTPLVIEFPKEPYQAPTSVSFKGLATPMDNTCPYLGNVTQTDGLVTVPFNKLGAAIPPATATNAAGFVASERASGFVWGRVKKVPAGYRVQMVFNDASSLKISPNMRAFKRENNVSQGDLFQLNAYGYGFAVNPAAADGFWYALNLTDTPKSNSFPADATASTALPMAQLTASIAPLKPPLGSPTPVVYPDECPKLIIQLLSAMEVFLLRLPAMIWLLTGGAQRHFGVAGRWIQANSAAAISKREASGIFFIEARNKWECLTS
jgi:hypothetical protein